MLCLLLVPSIRLVLLARRLRAIVSSQMQTPTPLPLVIAIAIARHYTDSLIIFVPVSLSIRKVYPRRSCQLSTSTRT